MGLFEYWPYSNFHELNANWLLNRVKQMSDYLNKLPELVQDWISEGLSDIDINQKILDAMTQFGMVINVVAPPNDLDPAKPDGSEEATATIQGCIDYANAQGGGVVFFPAGRYLSGPLTLKSNVVLMGFGRATTKIALRGGSTAPLISSNGSEMGIYGLTLDGNAESQTEDVTLISMKATDVDYSGLELTGGHILLNHHVSGGHCNVDDVMFNTCVQRAAMFSGAGELRVDGCVFNNLSAVGGVCVIENSVDHAKLDFTIRAEAQTGLVLNANECVVKCDIATTVNTPVDDNGRGNNVEVYDIFVRFNTQNANVTATGNANLTAGDVAADVTGKVNLTAGDVAADVTNMSVKAAEKIDLNGEDLKLNPNNPLIYKTPNNFNKYFKSIIFKDSNNLNYNVLVANENTKKISELFTDVRTVGVVGDGRADDTDALFNAIQTYKTVYIPDGVYNIRPNVLFISESNVIIYCNPNATFKLILDDSNIAPHGIELRGNNQQLYNFNLIGDRATRTNFTGDGGVGIYIAAYSNINVFNCNVQDYFGDGFYLGVGQSYAAYAENVNIINCSVQNCYRNGLSIVSAVNFLVDTFYANDINGTAPKCGIDIEPEANDTVIGTIQNIYTENCDGAGIALQPINAGADDINFDIAVRKFISKNDNIGVQFYCVSSASPLFNCDIDGVDIYKSQQKSIAIQSVATRGMISIKNVLIWRPAGDSIIYLDSMNSDSNVANILLENIRYKFVDNANIKGIKTVTTGGGRFNNTIIDFKGIPELSNDIDEKGFITFKTDMNSYILYGLISNNKATLSSKDIIFNKTETGIYSFTLPNRLFTFNTGNYAINIRLYNSNYTYEATKAANVATIKIFNDGTATDGDFEIEFIGYVEQSEY